MIEHFVQFTLNLPGSQEERQEHLNQIKTALEALPQTVAPLREMQVWINQNPNEVEGFMLRAVCDTWQDLDLYAKHPNHVAVVKQWIAPYKQSRSCVDAEM